MSDEENRGRGTHPRETPDHPHPHGGWQQTPQGDYDHDATAFVQLPPGDAPHASPLEAPGHGFVPPMIHPLTPADPSATGGWPARPEDERRWPEPSAGPHGEPPAADAHAGYPYPAQDMGARNGAHPDARGAAHHESHLHPQNASARPAHHSDPHAPHSGGYQEQGFALGSDQRARDHHADHHAGDHGTADQHAGDHRGAGRRGGAQQDTVQQDTAQWVFPEAERPGPPASPGSDVTGQWTIPVARGDLPEESGEFTTAMLQSQWGSAPATLPGGATAPWATEPPATLPGGAAAPWAPEPQEHQEPREAQESREPQETQEPHHPHQGQTQEPHHPHQGQTQGPHHPHQGQTQGPHHPHQGQTQGPVQAQGPGASVEPAESVAPVTPPESPDAPAPAADAPAAPPVDEARTPDPEPAEPRPTTEPPVEHTAVAETPADDDPVAEYAPEGPEEHTEPEATPGPAPETAPEPAQRQPESEPSADPVESSADPAPSEPPAQPEPEQQPDPADQPFPTVIDEHPPTSYVLRVNGTDRPVTDAWIGESLLYVLRERLGLAGAKDGCSQGECGACNVQVDGRLVASCLVPAATTAGSEVRTVEGLATDGEPSDVQRALANCGAVQCGFCIPGMAMTVHDLLEGNHKPSELETRQALCGNLCRCSGYRGVLDAVRDVVAEREASAAAADTTPEARIPHQAPPGAGSVQPHPHDGGMA
ncbi:2Fe-2S iron-sulfur cluster-binding protein [Streptomyces sp. NPDC020965]|uniref:2Fe-2S iron-sulfur cluster-binding protein n=1 Tax=Streptomyces sp. NPDC020965 TaxID=3365105 RepID=UPI0037A8F6D8